MMLSLVWNPKQSALHGATTGFLSCNDDSDAGDVESTGDIAVCCDSGLDKRRSSAISWGLGTLLPMKESSSRGSGAGAVQLVSEKDVGRPVMTDSVRSRLHNAHQTRYRISFEISTTSLLSLRKLRPRVAACLIAVPLVAQDLGGVRWYYFIATRL